MREWKFKGFDIVCAKKYALADITKEYDRNYVYNKIESRVLRMCELYNPVVVEMGAGCGDAIEVNPYEYFDNRHTRHEKRYCVKCGELKSVSEFDLIHGEYREMCKNCAKEFVKDVQVESLKKTKNDE